MPPDCTCTQLEQIEALEHLLGHQEDSITGEKGAGVIGALGYLSAQFQEARNQQAKDTLELRTQQAKDTESIKAEIAALRAEMQARREAPGKTLRWVIAMLPLLAATFAAINWAVNHMRVIP